MANRIYSFFFLTELQTSSPSNRVVQLSTLQVGTRTKVLKPKSSYRASAPSGCNPCAMKAAVTTARDRVSKGADTIAREGSLCHVSLSYITKSIQHHSWSCQSLFWGTAGQMDFFFFCGNVIENMNFEPYSGQFDIHKVVLSSQQNPHCLLVSQCWCTKVGDQKQQEQCILWCAKGKT